MNYTNSYSEQYARASHIANKGLFLGSIQETWKDVPGTLASTSDAPAVLAAPSSLVSTSRAVPVRFGTNLLLRLAYPATIAVSQDPTIRVLGIDQAGQFHYLINTPANKTAGVTTAFTTDVGDGTFKYTDVTASQVFDLQGSCNFIVMTATTAHGGGAGSVTTAKYQYKIV